MKQKTKLSVNTAVSPRKLSISSPISATPLSTKAVHDQWRVAFGRDIPQAEEDSILASHLRTPRELKMFRSLLSAKLILASTCAMCDSPNSIEHQFFSCPGTQIFLSHVSEIIARTLKIKRNVVLHDVVLFFPGIRELIDASTLPHLAIIHSCVLDTLFSSPQYAHYPVTFLAASFNSRLNARISLARKVPSPTRVSSLVSPVSCESPSNRDSRHDSLYESMERIGKKYDVPWY